MNINCYKKPLLTLLKSKFVELSTFIDILIIIIYNLICDEK